MKALNNREITAQYLQFLGYFTLLLCFTILCIHLFHKTNEAYSETLLRSKNETDQVFAQRIKLTEKIDSLNSLLKMLNSKQVKNEVALERSILSFKREISKELDLLEEVGKEDYLLYRKIIIGVEAALDNKKTIQQARMEEETQKKKLQDCVEANKKVQKALSDNPID